MRCIVLNPANYVFDLPGILELGVEPGTGIGPPSFDGAKRLAESLGRFGHAHTREETEFDEFRHLGIVAFESAQHFVNGKQRFRIGRVLQSQIVQIQIRAGGAMHSSLFNENATHRFCRSGEEVTTIGKPVGVGGANKSQVRFMYQGCRLQELSGLFMIQFLRSEFTQLIVDQREQ